MVAEELAGGEVAIRSSVLDMKIKISNRWNTGLELRWEVEAKDYIYIYMGTEL